MYVAFDMGLYYLTFMGRNLENRKNVMLVQIMNSVGVNGNIIIVVVGILNDNVAMNSIYGE